MPIALETLDDAWQHFVHRVLAYEPYDEPSAAAVADDEALSAFVAAHPGAFEERLLGGIAELAASQGLDELSRLDVLLRGMRRSNGPLAATLGALDPVAGLAFCARVDRQHGAGLFGAGHFVPRIDAAAASRLSPEMRDAIAGPPLPDILPGDLDGMTPEDIEAAFEAYTRVPIAEVEARLRPGACSWTGFLAARERLGEVIARDARRLRELGVDRRELAARLARVCASNSACTRAGRSLCEALSGSPERGWDVADASLEMEIRAWDGYQEDPFHTLWIHLCDMDFTLRDRRLSGELLIQSSPLALVLIRRACFFEGAVPHRIDPEAAARMVGLLR